MELAQQADGYKGVYFSKEYIAKNILQFTDAEWEQMKKEMDAEANEEGGDDFGDDNEDHDNEDHANDADDSNADASDSSDSEKEPDTVADEPEEEVDVLAELREQ